MALNSLSCADVPLSNYSLTHALHFPGAPVCPPSRWAATSNVEVGQTTYPVNIGMVGREGREGREGQSHKEEKKEGGSGRGEGARDC